MIAIGYSHRRSNRFAVKIPWIQLNRYSLPLVSFVPGDQMPAIFQRLPKIGIYAAGGMLLFAETIITASTHGRVEKLPRRGTRKSFNAWQV